MTTKTYAITEEQRDEILNALSISDYADDGEHVSATELLQSLPMVSGEPVAWTWDTMGSGGMSAGYRMAHFQMNKPEKTATMFDLTPLYTHAQPITDTKP